MKSFLLVLLVTISNSCLPQIKDSVPQKTSSAQAVQVLQPSSPKLDSISSKLDLITEKLDEKEGLLSKIFGWLKDILIPLVIGLLAFYSIKVQTKGSSVSTFRVNWIEQLRSNYSEFYVALHKVGSKYRAGLLQPHDYKDDPDAEKMLLMRAKIKLLLNHNKVTDPEHKEFWDKLVDYMVSFQTYYSSGKLSDETESELDQKRIDIEDILLVIFKKEWNKAKNFE